MKLNDVSRLSLFSKAIFCDRISGNMLNADIFGEKNAKGFLMEEKISLIRNLNSTFKGSHLRKQLSRFKNKYFYEVCNNWKQNDKVRLL